MTYNPYRKHEFAPIPVEVMRSPVLSSNDKVLYGALLRRAGRDGRCYPSQYTLAEDCGLTRNQVRYSLRNLERRGYIIVDRPEPGGNSTYGFLQHPTFPHGESFHQPPLSEDTQIYQGMVNGSPQKDSIKDTCEQPAQTRLGPQLIHSKPPAREECSLCGGTGWRDATRNGISAVTRCSH